MSLNSVLVIGGDGVFVQNVLGPKLRELGVHVQWIWDRHTNPQYRVPTGCGGILILKSAISHGMADRAAVMARESGIPWARIEHRFSKALPLLRASGMLGPLEETPHKEPSDEDVYEVLLHYLLQEKAAGHNPSRGELQEVIQRALGAKARFTDKLLSKARNVSSQKTSHKENDMDTNETNTRVTLEQLTEWVVLLIEDRPEGTTEGWVTRLKDLAVGELPAEKELHDLVCKTHQEQQELWRSNSRTWPRGKKAAIMEMRREWGRRFVRGFLSEHGRMPSYSEVKKASMKVFTKPLHGDIIRLSRNNYLEDPPKPVQGNTRTDPIHSAVLYVREWHKGLSFTQRSLLENWCLHLKKDPTRATLTDEAQNLLRCFQQKPLAFIGAILRLLPEGQTVNKRFFRNAYQQALQRKLNTSGVPKMAEALGATHKLVQTRKSPVTTTIETGMSAIENTNVVSQLREDLAQMREKLERSITENTLLRSNLKSSQAQLAVMEKDKGTHAAEHQNTVYALAEARRQLHQAQTELEDCKGPKTESSMSMKTHTSDMVQQVMAMGYRLVIEPAT